VRREVLVLVSALARTDRHTAMLAGRGGSRFGSPKSTCSHCSARASSVCTSVHSDSITYAWVRDPAASAAAVRAFAWPSVMLRLGLPSRPGGVPVSADTFGRTRFKACARVIARVSSRCAIATVEPLRVTATAASARSTSATSRSRSRTLPMTASSGSSTYLFFATVFGFRPGIPPVSQSSQHRRTV
jgi:hypothetical protein